MRQPTHNHNTGTQSRTNTHDRVSKQLTNITLADGCAPGDVMYTRTGIFIRFEVQAHHAHHTIPRRPCEIVQFVKRAWKNRSFHESRDRKMFSRE